MKFEHCLGIVLAMALASCGPQREPQQPVKNSAAPMLPAPSAPPAVTNKPAPAPPQAEPTIDAKSSEAAVAVTQGFADLLNKRKFDEAYMLLGPAAPPRAQFDQHFSRYSDLKVTLGTPGTQEGAAGSIYLSIPLTVSGVLEGKSSKRSATAILRRVNDVPGSTEAQRRWHLERIDWGG